MNTIISFRRSHLMLATLWLSCIGTPLYAQTQPVTLAWDANSEPSVVGYVVYVGNASGSYTEQYDVGRETTFVYTKVNAGRPYYFAVAAYTPGHNLSPPSEEIFFLTGAVSSSSSSSSSTASVAASPDRSGLCTAAQLTLCYNVDRLINFPGSATALTPTDDGRLLFIADGTDVRVIAGDTLMPDAALTAEDSTRLGTLVLDPLFDRNRYVYVSEILTRADGRRELSLVRYREVASIFAEGAAIVTGIPLPQSGDAPFTIDAARRLYIAVPASSDGLATPYSGMVLRFESDGSVPHDSRGGSPVLAHGYAEPVSLVWSGVRNEMWLAGAGADWEGALARLPLGDDSTEWPRVPRSASLGADTSVVSLFSAARSTQAFSASGATSGNLILVDDDGALRRIDGQTRQIAPATSLSPSDLGGEPVSAALDGADVYIVVTPLTDQQVSPSAIIRLRPVTR